MWASGTSGIYTAPPLQNLDSTNKEGVDSAGTNDINGFLL